MSSIHGNAAVMYKQCLTLYFYCGSGSDSALFRRELSQQCVWAQRSSVSSRTNVSWIWLLWKERSSADWEARPEDGD